MTPSPEPVPVLVGDEDIIRWARGLEERHERLRAERDRYRAALEEAEASFPDAREMGRVVRRALRADPTEAPPHACEHFDAHSPSFYTEGTCEWCSAQNGTLRYERAHYEEE